MTAKRAAPAPRRAGLLAPSPGSTNGSGTGLHRVRALDGLRGVAVLAVVIFHFSPGVAPGGFLGVDVFFVLSGFLITSLLVDERDRTAGIGLRAFWLRRARRLLPALLALLAALGAYALLAASEADAHRIGEDGLATLGYIANWHFLGSGQDYIEQFVSRAPSPLRHTWSLGIEEQFYVLWPLLALGISALVRHRTRRNPRRGRRQYRHALATVCVAGAIASLTLMVLLFEPSSPNRVYYGTDTRAFLLLAGAALGALTGGKVALAEGSARRALVACGAVAFAVLVGMFALVHITDSWLYRGGYGLIAVLVVVALAAAAQPGANHLTRVLTNRGLVGLGLISYGVYLWHWPISLWLTEAETGLHGVGLFALRSAATLAAALASYFLVEHPIRKGRLHYLFPRPARATAAIAACVFAVLLVPALTFAAVEAPPRVAPSATSAIRTAEYETVTRCDHEFTAGVPKELGVSPPADQIDRPLIQLAGNSIAAELVPCLANIVERLGGTLETVAKPAVAACSLPPKIEEQVGDRTTRPDVAIWFAWDTLESCGGEWRDHVRAAIRVWKKAGVRVYLVPLVPAVTPSSDPSVIAFGCCGRRVVSPTQAEEFERWAQRDPEHLSVIDAGLFIRDGAGAYQWRMPCLGGGEPGCDDQGTVGVRFVDGFHFCASQGFGGAGCPVGFDAGERRVAAAIALHIEELRTAPRATPARKEAG